MTKWFSNCTHITNRVGFWNKISPHPPPLGAQAENHQIIYITINLTSPLNETLPSIVLDCYYLYRLKRFPIDTSQFNAVRIDIAVV
jgi:hypothetical protein